MKRFVCAAVLALSSSAAVAQETPASTEGEGIRYGFGFRPFDFRGYSSKLDKAKFKTNSYSFEIDLPDEEPLPSPLPTPSTTRTSSTYPDLDRAVDGRGNVLMTFPWSVDELLRRTHLWAEYRNWVARFSFAPWLVDFETLGTPLGDFEDYAENDAGDAFTRPEPNVMENAIPASLVRLGRKMGEWEYGLSFAWDTGSRAAGSEKRWSYVYTTGLYGQTSLPLARMNLVLGTGLHYVTANRASINESTSSTLPDVRTTRTVDGTVQPEPTPDPNPVEIARRNRSEDRTKLSGVSLEASVEARYGLTERCEAWTALRMSYSQLSGEAFRRSSREQRRHTRTDSRLMMQSSHESKATYRVGVTAWIWEMAGLQYSF